MKKEGIFHTLCMFLQKNQKVFDILTVYSHYGLPLAILLLLRQPLFLSAVICYYSFNSAIVTPVSPSPKVPERKALIFLCERKCA